MTTLVAVRVALGGGAGLLDPGSWFAERPKTWRHTTDGEDLLLSGRVSQPADGPAVDRLLITVRGRLAEINTVSREDAGRFTIFDLTDVRTRLDGPPANALACRERAATARFAVDTAAAYLTRVINWLTERAAASQQVVRHRLAAAAVALSCGRAVVEQLSTVDDPCLAATLCAAALEAALEAAELCAETHAGQSIVAAELDQLRVLAAVEPAPITPVLPAQPDYRPAASHDVRELVAGLDAPTDLASELGRVEALAQTLPVGVCARLVTHRQVATGYLTGTRWHDDLSAGKALAAIAVTEPHGGSDLAALRTTAAPGPGGLVLNGTKTLVAGGVDADVLVVAAVLDRPGIPRRPVLLAIDAGRPEVRRTELRTPVWPGCGFATVEFQDYRLDPDELLRTPDNRIAGTAELLMGLVRERLVLAAQQLGFARRRLIDLPGQARLRLRFTAATALLRQSGPDMVEASMAKLVCCAVAADIANVGLLGTDEHLADLASARAALLAAGTPDINREIVAASLLPGLPRWDNHR
ncbi:MAG TPA: acyl-CoA dehydrogenase family protein [Pseudonocardiaceae bacterium]|nr:acyl-CoA dehydrogenase family protein [Pseudonocardiaceae bacterium]